LFGRDKLLNRDDKAVNVQITRKDRWKISNPLMGTHPFCKGRRRLWIWARKGQTDWGPMVLNASVTAVLCVLELKILSQSNKTLVKTQRT